MRRARASNASAPGSSRFAFVDERGVSEVVGFVVVFGIIIGSVGILYTTGFGAMEEFRENEQQRNADYAFDALAENFNDLVRNDGIRQRSGELNLRKGTIEVGSSNVVKEVTVDGTDVLEPHLNDTGRSDIGSFTYEYEGTTVAYQGGAVTKVTDSGELAVRNPPMQCIDGETAIVSLVVVDGDPPRLTSSSGREITASKRATTVVRGNSVDIVLGTSPAEPAWNRSLSEQGFSGSGNTFTCGGGSSGSVVVRITTVEIAYD
ncbi:DUF7289 family protein [Halovivax limisalsi]|uniref:DUF7289 family protein n=1 Tax=Halovivax limisalsi TaxID=1453760 RepID=UPI001FFCC6CC|nr:hypothetical protein [Halovivax limisalsi]